MPFTVRLPNYTGQIKSLYIMKTEHVKNRKTNTEVITPVILPNVELF